MSYLYGDSTQSDLTSNFLELLRDAIDFSVFVLEADEKIRAGKATTAALREEADGELARLDHFIGVVNAAVDGAEKGDGGSPTAQCAARVSELVSGAQRSSSDAIRGKLASEIAEIDAEEAATRDACHEALAVFMGPHGTEDTRATQRIAFMQHGTYEATLAGASSFGLDWLIDLAIPEGNLWSSQLRVERIAEHFEIRAPQVAGWITKEVKVRPQRLERHTVTELTTDGEQSHVKLRIEASVETGFDLDVDHGTNGVKMTRIGASDDQAAGTFDVHGDDIPLLLDLVTKLNEAAAQFDRARLAQAAVEDVEFRALPMFAPLVERLVATLAPIVRQIAARSLTPTELVLRRALGDDRREEIFVAKSTLREKYAVLPPQLRAMFSPLGLDPPPTPGASNAPAKPAPISERPSVRAEIRRSQPPPSIVRPPPPPVAARPAAPPAPAVIAPPPESSNNNKNEAFVEAVKKIVLVLKSGRTDEGYGQYAELLSSPSFTEYRADDQRQALKLLLLAKAPDGRSEAVMRAYRIALTRIQALVDAMAEPADYEMLGVAHLQLEDKPAAAAAFEIALKLERARAPTSELCNNLTRRANSL